MDFWFLVNFMGINLFIILDVCYKTGWNWNLYKLYNLHDAMLHSDLFLLAGKPFSSLLTWLVKVFQVY